MTAATEKKEIPLWFPENFNWHDADYREVFKERAERLQAMRADPESIPALKAFYKMHPAHFIHDFGMTSDPRNAEIGKPVTVPFLLFQKQHEFIDWLYARWQKRQDGLCEKSRDMGASWLCVAFSIWMFLFHEDTVIGFGSRKEDLVDKLGDPKSLFWKARQFIAMLPPEFRPAGWNEQKHAPNMRILNPENGSSIIGESGDNIGRGARTSLYIKDEAAFFERPEAIDAALSQTSNCKIDISTPNGAGNPFYLKRHGGKILVFTFDWRDDPRKSQAWYDLQCQILDPVIVAQEIDRNYEGSVTNAFIPGEFVNAAMHRGPADVQAIGGLRVGIDVARFGDDKSAITFRRGRVLLKQVILKKLDIMQVASRAKQEIDAYKEKPEQIAVDTVGVGAGVADIMRAWYPDREDRRSGRIQKVVVDVTSNLRMNNGQDFNLRAFMWRQMKDWIIEAAIPNDPDLKIDLTALRYKFKAGELIMEEKSEAKSRGIKSPDQGDSLALTFAHPTVPFDKQKGKRLPRHASTVPGCGVLG